MQYPRVLTVAGSDPSGGAGLQADLKTFHALRCYGMAVVTALTAQNTVGVTAVEGVSPELLERQLAAIASDCPPLATKTGMLFSEDLVRVVARWAEGGALGRLVVDPVLVSTSGDRLAAPGAVAAIRDRLLPLAAVVTPNLAEAGALVGREVSDVAGAHEAAEELARVHGAVVLVKGGHQPGSEAIVDVVALPGERGHGRVHERLPLAATHGTGCALSAAVAAGLARGLTEVEAIDGGIEFVLAGLRSAFPVGAGAWPVNHMARGGAGGGA